MWPISSHSSGFGLAESRLGQFARWGFTLEHPDDHLLLLMHEGEWIAEFELV